MGNLLRVWHCIENLTIMERRGLKILVGEFMNVVLWSVELALESEKRRERHEERDKEDNGKMNTTAQDGERWYTY